MNPKIIKAYDSLVPIDQIVIDSMIATLVGKDKQIKDMATGIHELLDRKEEDES
jgi:hypothetical protein